MIVVGNQASRREKNTCPPFCHKLVLNMKMCRYSTQLFPLRNNSISRWRWRDVPSLKTIQIGSLSPSQPTNGSYVAPKCLNTPEEANENNGRWISNNSQNEREKERERTTIRWIISSFEAAGFVSRASWIRIKAKHCCYMCMYIYIYIFILYKVIRKTRKSNRDANNCLLIVDCSPSSWEWLACCNEQRPHWNRMELKHRPIHKTSTTTTLATTRNETVLLLRLRVQTIFSISNNSKEARIISRYSI